MRNQRIFVFTLIPVFWAVLIATVGGTSDFWLEFWWMFPIAFFIALTVNTVGISGAALFVPFFVLIFPLLATELSALQSVKLGLVTESFGLSSSALAFLAFGLVDRKIALTAVLGALPFVLIGAALSTYLPESILFIMIAGLLITSVILVNVEKRLHKKRRDEHEQEVIDLTGPEGEQVELVSLSGKTYRYCRTKSGFRTRLAGYSTGGFFQGSAGFGIGEMGIVAMILSGLPTRVAIGTSHLVVASTAIFASLIHVIYAGAGTASIPWNIPFVTVPAVILGGQTSPYLAAKLPTVLLERFISILFIVIAASLLYLAFL